MRPAALQLHTSSKSQKMPHIYLRPFFMCMQPLKDHEHMIRAACFALVYSSAAFAPRLLEAFSISMGPAEDYRDPEYDSGDHMSSWGWGLEKFPEVLCELTNLQGISMTRQSLLSQLPPTVSNLKKLAVLRL